jgi:signal transduction histidine kinase
LGGDFGQLNERGQKNLKIVDASVNRLGDLVEDLLNVSRIEQKRLEVVATKVEAKQILASIIDEFELRVQEKNIELKLNIAEDLPLMLADADKLRQILVNLIGNSIKYTKKGEIELSAKKQDRKFVRIAVKDSGIGISAKARERLFDKFYRVQSEETEGIVGTGLGLWITKQLVELMGGQIFVDSIEHVGSQFYFTIPIYTEEVKAIKNV